MSDESRLSPAAVRQDAEARPSDTELDELATEMSAVRAYGLARRNHVPIEADYRCRYCGAPCKEDGVCSAHAPIHRADVETVESLGQLSIEDVIALEAAETGEDVEALKGKGSR